MTHFKSQKVGLFSLIAFVFSAMVGGGVYDLPQNMAMHAGLVGSILGWSLSGFIIWCIVKCFLVLSEVHPEYQAGLYHYAEAGFGKFAAFFVSWGYWICQAFAVGAYSVLLMSTLDAFFPGLFTNGNTFLSVVLGSIILWLIVFLVLSGMHISSRVDLLATIFKLGVIVIFILAMIVVFNWHTFTTDMLANITINKLEDKKLGSVFNQIKGNMITTLWVFSGVEGAVVLSGSAYNQKDVRIATKWGFICCLLVYSLVTILPLGLRSYGQVANIPGASMAGLMEIVMGPIGRIIITIGIIISILSSWLTWLIVLSEITRVAASNGTFPRIFNKVKRGVPISSVLCSGALIQIIIISSFFTKSAFTVLTSICGTMTAPAYLFSVLYLIKISQKEVTFNPQHKSLLVNRKRTQVIAFLAIIGITFMVLSAGINYLIISFIIYAVGIPIFIYTRKQVIQTNVFNYKELLFVLVIFILAIIGVFLLLFGKV